MKIAIIGNSYFGSILAKQLDSFDNNNKYYFFNTNESLIDKIKFFFFLLIADRVYSISASISGGGALKAAKFFNKKIIQHFIGSDVLSAKEDYKNNNIDKKLISKSNFLCEVDWIQKELEDINIQADIASIAIYDKDITPKPFTNFSVLTYMAKGKEEFYGIDDLINLAKNFKDVTFKVAGIDSYKKTLPSNIKLLGWVDMDKELQNSCCYIRNVKHDGLAFSVLEALGYGRIVFYNYNFPYVNYFSNIEELKEKIHNAKKAFENNELKLNKKAIDFIQKEFSKEKVLNNLIKILMQK